MRATGQITASIDRSLSPSLKPNIAYNVEYIKDYLERKKVKIALISFNLNKKVLESKRKWKLVTINEKFIERHVEKFMESIGIACQNKAKIICLSEMSYPLFDSDEKNSEIKDRLVNLSKAHKVYIVAGSCHDYKKTFFNIAPIFSPYHNEPFIQPKLFPSRTLEKGVKSASKMRITNFVTEYGRFCVSICYDTYSRDVRNMYNYVQRNRSFIGIDFIFVPSYNPNSPEGKDCCKDINLVSRACLVYVNDISQGLESAVFINNREEKQKPSFEDAGGDYRIYYYTVNIPELRELRKGLFITKRRG